MKRHNAVSNPTGAMKYMVMKLVPSGITKTKYRDRSFGRRWCKRKCCRFGSHRDKTAKYTP